MSVSLAVTLHFFLNVLFLNVYQAATYFNALCTRVELQSSFVKGLQVYSFQIGPWKGPVFFTRKTNRHHQMVSCCQGYLESSKHAGAPTPCRGDSPTMVLGLICTHPKAKAPRVSPCLHVVVLELPHFPNNSKAIKENNDRSAVYRFTIPRMHTWTCRTCHWPTTDLRKRS